MNKNIVPRRSTLYMPGANQRALQKARTLPADALILDLEDSVSPDAKLQARDNVLQNVQQGGYGEREVIIRVNGIDTEWGEDDIRTAAASDANAILLPKVQTVAELRCAADLMRVAGQARSLWMMAETPRCVLDIDALCSSGLIDVIVMGNADLAKSMRIPDDPLRTGLLGAMSQCVLAARARGLDILDGVFTDLEDTAGFSAQCLQGRQLGFDGKTLIHPRQIDAANDVFGVADEQAAEAEQVVSAWESAAAQGRGVAVVNGRMIEKLHADESRRLLALHAAQSERERGA